MKPDVVVDIGNSRMKWGRCSPTAVCETAVLPFDNRAAWQAHLVQWSLPPQATWIIGGVVPKHCAKFVDWLKENRQTALRIDSPDQLPLRTNVDHPERVGIDRLFNAVAANAGRPKDCAAIIIDAGSAITVDVVGPDGVFEGGAIGPGFRLSAQSLHHYTALLPEVSVTATKPTFPGKNTEDAIRAGVFWFVVGGIENLVQRTSGEHGEAPALFLTGGDANLLDSAFSFEATHRPDLTLDGIRLTALSLAN